MVHASSFSESYRSPQMIYFSQCVYFCNWFKIFGHSSNTMNQHSYNRITIHPWLFLTPWTATCQAMVSEYFLMIFPSTIWSISAYKIMWWHIYRDLKLILKRKKQTKSLLSYLPVRLRCFICLFTDVYT